MSKATANYEVDIGSADGYGKALRHHLTFRSLHSSEYLKALLFRSAPLPESTSEQDDFACMQAECPHLGADLSNAELIDMEDTKILLCPWHSYDFDLKTGESSTGLKSCIFPTRLEGNHLLVSFEKEYELVASRPVSEAFAKTEAIEAIDTLSISETEPVTLTDWASLILQTPDPSKKVALTQKAVDLFRKGKIKQIGRTPPPEEPPRQSNLQILKPGQMKTRKGGSERSRISLLHALANVEQWAIDLALDIICRFPTFNGKQMPLSFFSDWLKVAEDEAKHFTLLQARLESLGSGFGQLPAHNGLWQSARDTSDSLAARLCIIHLVHESRGLDVNPNQIARFRDAGDLDSAESLTTIHNDEITHVMAGHRWLTWVCEQTNEDPIQVFRETVKANFYGALKPPFNDADRQKAGLSKAYYVDLEGRNSEKDYTRPLKNATAGG